MPQSYRRACDALAKFVYRFASCLLTRRVNLVAQTFRPSHNVLFYAFYKLSAKRRLFPHPMLVSLFQLLSKLPLSVLHAIGAAIGWLVYLLSPSYRRKLTDNLGRAGYQRHLSQAIRES